MWSGCRAYRTTYFYITYSSISQVNLNKSNYILLPNNNSIQSVLAYTVLWGFYNILPHIQAAIIWLLMFSQLQQQPHSKVTQAEIQEAVEKYGFLKLSKNEKENWESAEMKPMSNMKSLHPWWSAEEGWHRIHSGILKGLTHGCVKYIPNYDPQVKVSLMDRIQEEGGVSDMVGNLFYKWTKWLKNYWTLGLRIRFFFASCACTTPKVRILYFEYICIYCIYKKKIKMF